MEASDPENWSEVKKILVILAHPDDPEFFCGATIARWTRMGHQVYYALLTRGDKGGNGRWVDPVELVEKREAEQKAAGAILGVSKITFLDYPDGYLQASPETRKAVVRLIREERPNIVVSCDPTNYFHRNNRINHPDHRAAGQIVLEAIYPASGNMLYYPELLDEGLGAHQVEEVWFSLSREPNTTIDVTSTWEVRLQALHQHRSQIDDMAKFDQAQRNRRTPDSTLESPRYEESFRRVVFEN